MASTTERDRRRERRRQRRERRSGATLVQDRPVPDVSPLHGRVASVLATDDVSAIHDATLQVMEEIGLRFDDPQALAIFEGHPDALVDGNRVRFRPRLVEWAINEAPGRFTLHARNPKYDVALGEGKVYYTGGFGATYVCDVAQQVYRDATLEDLRNYYTVGDYLENAHYLLMAFVPQDISPEFTELYAIAVQFDSTEKHIGLSTPHAHFMDEILAVGRWVTESCGAAGPVFHWGMTANSPLTYSDEMTPKAIRCAEEGIPFRISCGPLAGATAPVTLAGTVVIQNAEILAGLTLCQLVQPGTPVIYGTFGGAMDMQSGKWASAGPEMALVNAATSQLCRMYDVPLGYGTGGIADARTPDVQAGLEKALTVLFTALTGVEVIHHGVSGNLAGAMANSLEQLVIDNEIAKMINQLLAGFDVTPDTLAVDVIKAVGPGGHFLDQPHTISRFQQELYMSPLLDRQYELEWPDSMEEIMLGHASAKVRQILANHKPPSLDAELQARIQDVLDRLTGGERRVFERSD
jgi:trimethylamine--corrinoid protein Co-methyltransferase